MRFWRKAASIARHRPEKKKTYMYTMIILHANQLTHAIFPSVNMLHIQIMPEMPWKIPKSPFFKSSALLCYTTKIQRVIFRKRLWLSKMAD